MRIHLERFGFGTDSTLGKMTVPGQEQVWVLEDEYREQKVMGETCIPYGTFEVTRRAEGGFHQRYAERFPEMHKGMLWLRNVPGFEYILIHVGNDEGDTAGCLLVGERGYMNDKGEFTVGRSTDAYKRIYPVILDALEAGDEVTIRVARRWDQTEHG